MACSSARDEITGENAWGSRILHCTGAFAQNGTHHFFTAAENTPAALMSDLTCGIIKHDRVLPHTVNGVTR